MSAIDEPYRSAVLDAVWDGRPDEAWAVIDSLTKPGWYCPLDMYAGIQGELAEACS